MRYPTSRSRRDFLRMGGRTLSALGAASAFGHLGRMSALAQGPDYKALVCIFLFGGNDSNNMVVPLAAADYQNYQRVRQNLAIPAANLLPVAGPAGASYGLHPSLAALRNLYQLQKAAIVLNLGTLVQPLTKTQYQSGGLAPLNLFSHSDQQQQWQNAAPRGGAWAGTGWSGRAADQVYLLNGTTFSPSIGVGGNALQLLGNITKPTAVGDTDFGLAGSDGSAAAQARDAAMQQILTLDSGVLLVQGASKVLSDALAVVRMVEDAVQSAPPLASQFPGTGLGNQLSQVARVIQVRNALGLRRQIFFCSQGGYDTHGTQLPAHAQLLTELSEAMSAFYAATGELGVQNNVVTFTESEFNRTFQPNGTAGTDHAWGGHQFVLGGPVRGGVYGRMPALVLRGPDDSGDRGNWIPTLSLDQYGAALAQWFGVADLRAVFPNLGNFPPSALSFL